jgi:catechol 2,3-dioxygenase-like lactoylglutathione lyase family enzyme
MPESKTSKSQKARPGKILTFSATSAVVRYQVKDLDRAVAFYTRHLGFELVGQPGPVAIIRRGDLRLVLSGPGASGSRSIPGGREQEPGGWNRIVLYFDDIDPTVAALEAADARFRNEMEHGPAGKQIQVDDPDGNPIELHEAPKE